MDIFITEADGYPVINAWSTFELAAEELVAMFGIDMDELKADPKEAGVWKAPGDMQMQNAYITKRTVDVKAVG